MRMHGTTPRAPSWRGCLAVFGLGALALLPARGLAQPPVRVEEKEESPTSTPRVVVVGDDDLNQGQSELLELEAQLAQKQAETAAFAARVAAVRAKVKAQQAAGAAQTKRSEGDPKNPLVPGPAGLTFDLKKLLSANHGAAPPGVVVLDEGTGKIVVRLIGENGPTPAADPDNRINDLETRLKSILDEVEKLRRERKPDAPESRADPNQHGNGAPVLEKIPYLDRLFKTVSSAEGLERERAMKEAEAARQQAEAAEQAKKRMEETNAKLAEAGDQLQKANVFLKEALEEKARAEADAQAARAEAARLKKELEDLRRAKEAEDKKPSGPESKGPPKQPASP